MLLVFAEVLHGYKRWFLTPPDYKPIFNPDETSFYWITEVDCRRAGLQRLLMSMQRCCRPLSIMKQPRRCLSAFWNPIKFFGVSLA